jgi:hypothetical protein
MKQFYFSVIVALFFTAGNTQTINIPDSALMGNLLQFASNNNAKDIHGNFIHIDANNNFQIEVSEALAIYQLTLPFAGIHDFTGIEYFQNLTYFKCNDVADPNDFIDTLDVRTMTSLQYLYCNGNGLNHLLVDGLTHLKWLQCASNDFTSLNLSGLASLETLLCNSTTLTQLDLSMLPSLYAVNCSNSNISSLNVSGLNNLSGLDCHANQLTTLDLSNTPNLQSVQCGENNMTNLNLSGLTQLETLYCDFNDLVTLDLSTCTDLKTLICYYNQITALDLSNATQLTLVKCFGNQLTTLDVTGLSALTYFSCDQNQLLSIYMKGIGYNGSTDHFLTFSENPNLVLICADTAILPLVQNLANDAGLTNCEISDCELGNQEFTVDDSIFIAPNPVADVLHVSAGDVSEIDIYNSLGQLVRHISEIDDLAIIDVSDLKTGHYVIKADSAKGKLTTKFMKL